MKTTAKHAAARDWEELGSMDPLYAVLSHGDKKFGKWDEREFYNGLGKLYQHIREISGTIST